MVSTPVGGAPHLLAALGGQQSLHKPSQPVVEICVGKTGDEDNDYDMQIVTTLPVKPAAAAVHNIWTFVYVSLKYLNS